MEKGEFPINYMEIHGVALNLHEHNWEMALAQGTVQHSHISRNLETTLPEPDSDWTNNSQISHLFLCNNLNITSLNIERNKVTVDNSHTRAVSRLLS